MKNCLIRSENIAKIGKSWWYCCVADDGWSISSTFSQQTVEQLKVAQEVVYKCIYKLNDLLSNEQKIKRSILSYSRFICRKTL